MFGIFYERREKEMSAHRIICGKSEIELKRFDDNTFDSCVTDPPYKLEFMGKEWDSLDKKYKEGQFVPCETCDGKGTVFESGVEVACPDCLGSGVNIMPQSNPMQQFFYGWATELYMVMKPGAHILVFGGTRTYHRMACAVEDAGFEVRDMIEWFYGSGFPKSLDISKSIDKMKGKEREVISKNPNARNTGGNINICKKNGTGTITAPTTEEAIQWNGWGTAMKPAHEPILLARKPISECNIAANVLKWGVGGLNIDKSRISFNGDVPNPSSSGWKRTNAINANHGFRPNAYVGEDKDWYPKQGRFPANLILDDDAGQMLDEQSGELTTGEMNSVAKGGQFATYGYQYPRETVSHGSKGGASRFFYQAKAPQKERWFYCTICKEAYPMKEKDNHIHGAPEKTKYQYLESHPTQKPEALISYLARLITPPNGIMLDLFLGSGTGLIAAEQEGFNCVGIDSKREYCLMSYQRLKNEIEQEQTKLFSERSTIEKINF